MTPAQAIGMLDRQLASHGEDINVRRSGENKDMRAFVRGFKPDELVGLIQQGDRAVTVSPSSFGAFGAPEQHDRVVLAGDVLATVINVELVRLAGTVVRANLVVRGE